MFIESYTKNVLTVIAVCLAVLTLQSVGFFPTATATSPTTNSYALVPLNPDGSVTVRLNNGIIDVNLKQISDRPSSSWGNGYPVPVKEK